MQTSQSLRQAITNAGDSFVPEPGHSFQTPVMSRGFEFLQSLDAQLVVQLPCGVFADARHGGQQRNRIAFATQPLQHVRATMQDDVANDMGDGVADTGDLFQASQPIALEDP